MFRTYRKMDELELMMPDHFPVQVVFNSAPDNFFLTFMECLATGSGFGVDYGACLYTDLLHAFEQGPNNVEHSVEFSLHNGQECYLDYKTFIYYLEVVCKRQIEQYPQQREQLQEILGRIKKRLKVD